MPARWVQAKLIKERRRKRGLPVRAPQTPSRNRLPEDARPLYEYRHRGTSLGFDEAFNFWFFKQDRHLMEVDFVDENGKRAQKIVSKRGVLEGGYTVSDERLKSVKESKEQDPVIAQTDLQDWMGEFNSITLVETEKGWIKCFYDRTLICLVEKVDERTIRKSITYSIHSKQRLYRWAQQKPEAIRWFPPVKISLECKAAPDPPLDMERKTFE